MVPICVLILLRVLAGEVDQARRRGGIGGGKLPLDLASVGLCRVLGGVLVNPELDGERGALVDLRHVGLQIVGYNRALTVVNGVGR